MLFLTPGDILDKLAMGLKNSRVRAGLTQEELALKANVSVSVLRKFEQTGRISLESFVKLAFTVGFEEELVGLFDSSSTNNLSMDELLKAKKSKKRVKPFKARKARS